MHGVGTKWRIEMAKTKSKKQVALLLSKGSPLTLTQKARLRKELRSGAVKVRK